MSSAIKKFFILFAAAMIFSSSSAPRADGAGLTMEAAFRAQDWRSADELFRAADATSEDLFPKPLSAQDTSLYINALWRQSKYSAARPLIERALDDRIFPKEIEPYARMLLVLALERTESYDEAALAGEALWESAPLQVRYYLAFAMARISTARKVPKESLKWYRHMLAHAPDRRSKSRALEAMIALPGITPDEAAEALIVTPSSSRALALVQALPADSGGSVSYALGLRAYNAKKYSEAAKLFAAAENDAKYGEAARYYRAYSNFRVKGYDRALAIWGDLALKSKEYSQRSIARLIALAKSAKRADVIAILKRVGVERSDQPEVAADALVGVASLGSAQDITWARHALLERYASTDQAVGLLWIEGWKEWKAGRPTAALEEWSRADLSGVSRRETASRFRYWIYRAHVALKDKEGAERAKRELIEKSPAEYHTFLVDASGGITDAPLPASLDVRSETERWGFITYARLEAAAGAALGDAPSAYAFSRLAAWEGDYPTAARASGILQRIAPEIFSSPAALKLSHPRAHAQEVAAARKTTGLSEEQIWAIMRQESMYEADVTSSAGAYGLMQLMPATAAEVEKKLKMPAGSYKTPAKNIILGAHYFVGLLAAFKGNVEQSLAAYNAGGGRVRKWSEGGIADMAQWVEDIPFSETRGYVKAVVRNLNIYKKIYQKKEAQAK